MDNQNKGGILGNINLPTINLEFNTTNLVYMGVTIFVAISMASIINAIVSKALR